MHFLVTGSSGFLGRHITLALLDHGVRLTLLVRREASSAFLRNTLPALPTGSHITRIEGTLEKVEQSKLCAAGPFDGVIHCAWSDVGDPHSPRHMQEHLPVSFEFLQRVATLCRGRIAVTGSCLEYGNGRGEISEDTPCIPDTEYGRAKYELYQRLSELPRIDLVWARFFYLYGAGQREGSLYSTIYQAHRDNASIVQLATPSAEHDFIPVQQAAAIFSKLLLDGHSGVYNVSSGQVESVGVVAQSIASTIGYKGKLECTAKQASLGAGVHVKGVCFGWGSQRKVRAAFGSDE